MSHSIGPYSDAVSVAQAQHMVLQRIQPIHELEKIAIRTALGRVLGADIVSPIDVPPHDNSAMDGYALNGSDLKSYGVTTLKIVGVAQAGRAYAGAVRPGECMRIMTGALLPNGCDTVVPQEYVHAQSDSVITIPAGAIKSGDHCRLRGEDLAAGGIALAKGKILHPAEIGLLASMGMSDVSVYRRLRVAFFSTGDELRSVDQSLEKGGVYDSNRYTLHGMLTRLGCDLIDKGLVKDDAACLEAAFRNACGQADVIIASGGASAGATDYTRQVIAKLGGIDFGRVAMRPGSPMIFGRISSHGESACVFGMPGNPVAVMVAFYFIARTALLHMMGAKPMPLWSMPAMAQTAIRKKPGRTEYQRGILSNDEGGRQWVRLTGSQGSGILRSMSEANCMVVLRHDQGNIEAGELVDVVVLEGLI